VVYGAFGLTFRRAAFGLILVALLCIAYMYSAAVRDPVIRRASIAMPDWPADTPTIKVMLVSDVHVAGPDMPPERLARIVAQINAAKPDLVLFAGDFVSDKRLSTHRYPALQALAPLAQLKAPLGVVAVLGNHDHWRDVGEITVALDSAKVALLNNNAMRRGQLIIGGVDDDFTGHSQTAETVAAMARLTEDMTDPRPAAKIILSHSPDIMPELPRAGQPGYVSLLLAGHTHCGQIALPFVGPVSSVSRYGQRYNCGVIREDGKTLIVGAGLGTSILPLRLGAVPDMWLLNLGPNAKP
jgi:uncharacterized protein